MGERIAVSGAAAGAAGASYRKILTFSSMAAGNYVLNDANFSGLGPYLPCFATVQISPGAAGAKLQISSDNGTTWFDVAGGTTQQSEFLYLDTANTYRVSITTNPADVRIFVL
jgi:hypothetical protein